MAYRRSTSLSDPAVVSSWRFLNQNTTAAPRGPLSGKHVRGGSVGKGAAEAGPRPPGCAPAGVEGFLATTHKFSAVSEVSDAVDLISRAELLLDSAAEVQSRQSLPQETVGDPPRQGRGMHPAHPHGRAVRKAAGVDFDVYRYGSVQAAVVETSPELGQGDGMERDDSRVSADRGGDPPEPSNSGGAALQKIIREGGALDTAVRMNVVRAGGMRTSNKPEPVLPPLVDSSFNYTPRSRKRAPRYGAWYLPVNSWQLGGTKKPVKKLTDEQRQHVEDSANEYIDKQNYFKGGEVTKPTQNYGHRYYPPDTIQLTP